MPQLTRLRFINIGHDRARMKDLIINLSDEQNHPLDSALWLRNGGGKSSLLSLFFSLINPKKLDFLGAKTTGGERLLKDYVQTGDHSIVVAEWKLDTASEEEPIWYLTGGFYEERNDIIERLFFSARVCQPDLTFENLPFKDEKGRRVLKHIFKQAWQNLGVKYPQADAHETETLRDWQRMLEKERIDAELFNYQVRMNSHEGGADELFRFKDTDHFVDFFINVAMPPDKSDQISDNLKKFRALLRRRKDQLLPGVELIEKIKPSITAIIAVAEKRFGHRKETGELQYDLTRLQEVITRRLTILTARESQIAALVRTASDALRKAIHQADIEESRALSLQRTRLEQRVERFAANQENLSKQLNEAEHQRRLWQAAIPLAEVEKHEEKARELQKLLQSQTAQFAPDWSAVETAAYDYAAALLWRVNETRREVSAKNEAAKTHRAKAEEARQTGKRERDEAVRAETQAEQKTRRIEQAKISRTKLEKSETLESNELVETADSRWRQKLDEMEEKKNHLENELKIAEEQTVSIDGNLSRMRQRQFEIKRDLESLSTSIEQATGKQNELLADVVLNKILEDVDETVLNQTSLARIKEVREESEIELRDLKSEVAENENVFEYLKSNNLLPPLRDVRTVLQILTDNGITAWAGWEHAAESFSKNEDARDFIAEHPEIVQGVLVRDEHFQDAKIILEQADKHLTSAVIVGAKSLALNGNSSSDSEKRFVAGPTSDAHFDKNAAKNEAVILESRLQEKRQRCAEIERWIHELSEAAENLKQFILQYSPEWFAQRRAELRDAEENLEKCEAQIITLEKERGENLTFIEVLKNKIEHLSSEKHGVEDHLRRLETHRNHYGTDADIASLEKEKIADEKRAEDLLNLSVEKEKTADNEENQARRLNEEAKKSSAEIERDERDSRNIKYLEKDVSPKAGDVDRLMESYRTLRELVEEKTDGNRLQKDLEDYERALKKSQEEFDKQFGGRVSETEVRRLLSTIIDKSTLPTKLEEFNNQIRELDRAVGKAESEMQIAQEQLNQHRNENLQLKYDVADDERNLDETELENLAQTMQTASEKSRVEANQQEREISRLKNENSQLQLEKQKCETEQKQTSDLLAEEDLFQNALEFAPESFDEFSDESQISSLLEDLKKKVFLARRKQTQIQDERQKIYKIFSDALREPNLDFAKELRTHDEDNLEQEAATLLSELETREKNIREELEDCDKHRNLLVIELANVADHGVQMLRNLANDSKLPDSVGTLSKQPFLKINLKKLELPEKHQRIGNLVDDIIGEAQTPNGIALLQRAVRKLAQPITVQVLFPDTDAPPRHIRITEMAKESGGERLTSAVLLYCALAQQRTRERGLKFSISGSLLLDNPVGTANRRQFLELQRDTARAMKIQLIYTTGVKDYEAIGTMPNIVQLRNERRNDNNQGLLEAVRVLRSDKDFDEINEPVK